MGIIVSIYVACVTFAYVALRSLPGLTPVRHIRSDYRVITVTNLVSWTRGTLIPKHHLLTPTAVGGVELRPSRCHLHQRYCRKEDHHGGFPIRLPPSWRIIRLPLHNHLMGPQRIPDRQTYQRATWSLWTWHSAGNADRSDGTTAITFTSVYVATSCRPHRIGVILYIHKYICFYFSCRNLNS